MLERLKTDLDGRVPVSVHTASTLFRQGTEVQALQRGNLEMSTMTTFEVAQQVPELGFMNRGYVFGDFCNGTIWSMPASGGRFTRLDLPAVQQLSSFGVDTGGELYAVSLTGTVFKFVRGS